jgi:hypothetical protein
MLRRETKIIDFWHLSSAAAAAQQTIFAAFASNTRWRARFTKVSSGRHSDA